MCLWSPFLKLCHTDSDDRAWEIQEALSGLGNKAGKHMGSAYIWCLHGEALKMWGEEAKVSQAAR